MAILLNGLKFIFFSAIAGKIICAQHVFTKYSNIIQQASESSHEVFSAAIYNSQFLSF